MSVHAGKATLSLLIRWCAPGVASGVRGPALWGLKNGEGFGGAATATVGFQRYARRSSTCQAHTNQGERSCAQRCEVQLSALCMIVEANAMGKDTT